MAKAAKAKTKATTTEKTPKKKPPIVTKKVVKKKKTKTADTAQEPFFQVKVTDQSLYWLIFGVVSIMFAMWIYTLDTKIRDLYDQIDASTYSTDSALMMRINRDKAAQETE